MSVHFVFGQDVTINYQDTPLNKVLISLRDQYDLKLSFDDELLSQCIISENKPYPSIDEAISSLAAQCNFKVDKINDVYLFKKQEIKKTSSVKPPSYIYSGRILDEETKESLPYSFIAFNGQVTTTDQNGSFIYRSKNAQLRIKVSHLGYNPIDTVIQYGSHLVLTSLPSYNNLEEIVVSVDSTVKASEFVKKPSSIKLNMEDAMFVPGNNNNIIFNQLRLYPGVLASGEQTKEFVIWGSYVGQSQIIYDGITLFNLSSQNQNIGVINPLLVKDLELYKAGYNVGVGDRVGGIVQLTSKDGNMEESVSTMSISNDILNITGSTPIHKNATIQAGVRRTIFDKVRPPKNYVHLPYHFFRDLNIKYSGYTKNDDKYYISIIQNKDNLSNERVGKDESSIIRQDRTNSQGGFAAFYSHKWKRLGNTDFTFSASSFRADFDNDFSEKDSSVLSAFYSNHIAEKSLKINHTLPTTKYQKASFNLQYTNYTNELTIAKNSEDSKSSISENSNLLALSVMDVIQLGPRLQAIPGIRTTYRMGGDVYFEPRMELFYNPFEKVKMKLSSGYYNQFLSQIPITIDDKFNFYHWAITDNVEAPLLSSMHHVTGISYDYKGIELSCDLFYKDIYNLTQFRTSTDNNNFTYQIGEALIYGFDMYVKKKIGRLTLWGNYTYNEIWETFNDVKQRAPHHLYHEWKGSMSYHIKRSFLSMSYVYGTPFPSSPTYRRLDLAYMYKFGKKKKRNELGISLQNVLNDRNMTLNNFIYTNDFPYRLMATPRSASLFLTLNF